MVKASVEVSEERRIILMSKSVYLKTGIVHSKDCKHQIAPDELWFHTSSTSNGAWGVVQS